MVASLGSSVFVSVAIAGFLLILLVTVIVVSGCCYYHRKIKKSIHVDLAPIQRLECTSDILLLCC